MNVNFAKLLTISITTLGVLVALVIGTIIADGSIGILLLISTAVVGTVWMLLAREAWWIAFLVIGNLIGAIHVGFRITPLELATLTSLAGFVPYYVFSRDSFNPPPIALPKIYLVAGLYFGFNLIMSLVLNRFDRIGDDANVVRVYSATLSAFAIGFLFYYFATLKHVRIAMILTYAVILGSLIVSVVADILAIQVFIPGINYVLDTGFNPEADGMQFFFARWLVVATLPFALFYAQCGRSITIRMVNVIIVAGLALMAFRAGGRAALLTCFLYGILWLVLTRRRGLLLAGIAAASLFVTVINIAPRVLNPLPVGVQKSVSFLVFDDRFAASLGLTSGAGSDTWHAALRDIAVDRWTRSPVSITLGHGARGFEGLIGRTFLIDRDAMYTNATQAANTGAYEKSIYALLALSGIVGLGLIAWLYWTTARRLVPFIWRNGIHDENGLVMFLALAPVLTWPLLGWIMGGLPHMELFYIAAGLAAAARLEFSPQPAAFSGDLVETYAET